MLLLILSQVFESTRAGRLFRFLLVATAYRRAGSAFTVPSAETRHSEPPPHPYVMRQSSSVLLLTALLVRLGTALAPVLAVAISSGLVLWWGPAPDVVDPARGVLGREPRPPLRTSQAARRRGRPALLREFAPLWMYAGFGRSNGVWITVNGNWSQLRQDEQARRVHDAAAIALTGRSVRCSRSDRGRLRRDDRRKSPSRRPTHPPVLLAATFRRDRRLPDGGELLRNRGVCRRGLGCSVRCRDISGFRRGRACGHAGSPFAAG